MKTWTKMVVVEMIIFVLYIPVIKIRWCLEYGVDREEEKVTPQYINKTLYWYSGYFYFLVCSHFKLLKLLLSCFSPVRLCATPRAAAYQAPPSLGFSSQEHWSGLPFPSPTHESEKWKWGRSVASEILQPHRL